jgi:hypothetical protein
MTDVDKPLSATTIVVKLSYAAGSSGVRPYRCYRSHRGDEVAGDVALGLDTVGHGAVLLQGLGHADERVRQLQRLHLRVGTRQREG